MIKYILCTSMFWLMLFGWAGLYSLFVYGAEVRLPAANPPAIESSGLDSVWAAVDGHRRR